MATAAVSAHVSGGALSLMSCVRESSPHESLSDYDSDKNVATKKRFWNPRKWFKRKNKVTEECKSEPSDPIIIKEPTRSRSASELSETDEQPVKRRSGTPMHPGLSVSHDSIFHSPHSGSELELEEAQSSSSLSIQHHPTQKELRLQTELSERLRLRRGHGDTSEDDEGLPRSPCCNSPTTMDGLNDKTPIKNHATKSHSTCSDGSLLSMGSSDIEEDSSGPHSSQHSSKVSLHEKKLSSEQGCDWELGSANVSTPLNHSAAHHRVSVRPKRTHGAPRRKRIQPVATSSALPTTPEVNEDLSLRSSTPEVSKKETVTELYCNISMSDTKTETQLKCSSLPPGLAAPTSENGKLNRSRSSAGSKSQDALCEEDEDKSDKKTESSIFARLFPRRSGKKKKSQEENVATITSTSSYTKHTSEIITPKQDDKKVVSKSGPASRQRFTPLDIPVTPEVNRKETETLSLALVESSSKKSTSTISTQHTKVDPQSPSFMSTSTLVWSDRSKTVSNSFESRNEQIEIKEEKNTKYESKSKVKIAGLSSLQQRVLLHNEDAVDNSFTSLTDFGRDEQVLTSHITKSHSFRTSTSNDTTVMMKGDFLIDNKTESSSIFKSSSCDSIKVLDEPKELSIKSDSTESLNSDTSAKTSTTEFLDSLNPCNNITISGPSHTSVVTVSTLGDAQIIKNEPVVFNAVNDTNNIKESPVTITTIQLKRDLNSATKSIPEFLNVQLNKVDFKPANNIVVTTPPKVASESKPIFNFETPPKSPLRKFSQDDIELVEKEINEQIVESPSKHITSPNVVVTAMAPPITTRIFKKNSEVVTQIRKSSLVLVASESKSKISLRTKSNSLDSDMPLTNLDKAEVKQKTVSTTDLKEEAVVRRKSLMKEKQDEEPELMKVFARRSLKVKDGEEIAQQVLNMINDTHLQTQDSDKENLVDQSNLITIEQEKLREPLIETKFIESTEVTLRKSINNKILAFQQRTTSLNVPKVNDINIEKQKSVFSDRPKTQIGNKINDLETKVVNMDISSKSDFINEDFPAVPKNFNQRKAEWEKRAQEALKKTIP